LLDGCCLHGDWDLLKIPVRTKWDFAIGRFANCTRLRPNPDSKTPSSYTALHQATCHGAPVKIVQGLIKLGSSRQCIFSLASTHFNLCLSSIGGLRTTNGKTQLSNLSMRGHRHLYDILMPTGLPEVTDEELSQVEAHFHKIIVEEAGGVLKPESMRFPLGVLRGQPRVWMPILGMYGVYVQSISVQSSRHILWCFT
jgi:hypothetical protein